MGQIIVDDSMRVAYIESRQAAVVFKGKSKRADVPIARSYNPSPIAYWGDDNLFPQTVVNEARASFVPSVLDWKARALYGGGIVFGKMQPDPNNPDQEKFVQSKKSENKEVWDFFARSNVKRYLMEAGKDLYWFYNVFPELILSNDRSQITQLSVQETAYCRWEKQNPNTGLVDNCYINANWPLGAQVNDSLTIKVPVIDPYYDPVASLRARKEFKFIYPLSIPSPNCSYYQLADWNSMRESGWLEISSAIPKWKKLLMKNQITIKYHIEVPEFYWSWKFGKGWDTMTVDKRKEAIKTELDAFNNFLSSEEGAGRSIMTTKRYNEQLNREYPGWTISAVDDKIKDGKYIEDSQEASSQMLYMLGVDGTLIGNSPGAGMGAGSGSDKRVALDIYLSLIEAHRDIVLEPLYFTRDYNEWDPELEFRIKNTLIATLNSGASTKQTTGDAPKNGN